MGDACSTHEKRKPWMVLVRETEGRSPLGRGRYRWRSKRKVVLKWHERRWPGLSWLNDRKELRAVVKAVMNLLVP